MNQLARIFHTDLLQKPGSLMDAALSSKSSSGSVYTHSRRQTPSLALPYQASQLPRHDQYEISGLVITALETKNFLAFLHLFLNASRISVSNISDCVSGSGKEMAALCLTVLKIFTTTKIERITIKNSIVTLTQ